MVRAKIFCQQLDAIGSPMKGTANPEHQTSMSKKREHRTLTTPACARGTEKSEYLASTNLMEGSEAARQGRMIPVVRQASATAHSALDSMHMQIR